MTVLRSHLRALSACVSRLWRSEGRGGATATASYLLEGGLPCYGAHRGAEPQRAVPAGRGVPDGVYP